MKRAQWMYGLMLLVAMLVMMNHVFLRSILYGSEPRVELSDKIQQCLVQLNSNSTKDSLYPHVQMNITQAMGTSLIDGYTMCVTCMASVSKGDAHMRWNGKGLKMSLWVNQLEPEKHRNCIVRKLCFSPWLNSQAGEYTCYVTVKDDNFTVTMNKTIIVNGEFHGLTNARDVSQKFDTNPFKPSKWFPDTNLCAEDDVWQKYADFHSSVLSGKQKAKYLIYDCTNNDPKFECGGYGNRIHSFTVLLMLSMLTKHVLLIQMSNPVDINDYLLPNAIQWNYTLPGGLESRYVDLFNKDNFYANYKPLEAALLGGGDDEYDAIKVRLNFGLFYFLVTMSDIIFNGLISTFNLKSQYDVVMLYGCAFHYLFKYQPPVLQAIDSLQAELGLESGEFVALHIRSHINDGEVFNPLHFKLPYKVMFECAKMAANSLRSKLNVSKVPIYFTTDHPSLIEYAKQNFKDAIVFSKAPRFHVDHTKYKGAQASSQYYSGMVGVMSDVEICARAGVLVRSADSSFSELMGAINFSRPQYNLLPYYFYENLSLCRRV